MDETSFMSDADGNNQGYKVGYKKPPLHTRIKKGETKNPNGRYAGNTIKNALARLTLDTYRDVINVVIGGDLASLKAMVTDPKSTALQVGIATSFIKAIQRGDYAVIERIAERIVGKIPERVQVQSVNEHNTTVSFDEKTLKAALEKLNDDI